MDSQPILHTWFKSSCAWRVRLALNLKEIDYKMKSVSLKNNEHLSEEFKKVNPMGYLPVLEIDGAVLSESFAILEYLEETRPEKNLLPKQPIDKAKVRQICNMVISGIQPLQNTIVLETVGEDRSLDWARFWVKRGFDALERVLAETSGKYCYGDSITLADCCLIPQTFNARNFGIDLGVYPVVSRICAELEKHPAFVRAHPYQQPDCQQGLC